MRNRSRLSTVLISIVVIQYLALPYVTIVMFTKYIGPHVSCAKDCDAETDPFADENFDDGLSKKTRTAFVRRQIASTVSIYTDNYTREKGLQDRGGTGVIIDDDCTVLTAWHVVDNAEFIQISFQRLMKDAATVEETKYVPMYVDAYDKDIDTAILKPVHEEDGLPPPMVMDMSWEPEKGELLWHFGSTTMWSQGMITNTSFLHSKLPIMKECVTMKIESDLGDSGGPVVTSDGSLVGIVLTISTGTKTKTHFMPISTIIETLGMSCH